MSRAELDFVGVYEPRPAERGWHQQDEIAVLASLYEQDADPRPEDAAILQRLMTADRTEFLA